MPAMYIVLPESVLEIGPGTTHGSRMGDWKVEAG